MRFSAAATALLVLLLAAPARGDGLPIAGVDAGPTGVASGDVRYVTLGSNVAAVSRHDGRIVRWRSLRPALTIPAVAADGSPSGLSADGRTLVLIRPRVSFPQSRTVLAVLDTGRLAVRRRVRLRGDYSFDAISPDGRTLFFIHYTSRVDPTRYEVRAYDTAAGRFLAHPIVDPRERGERMSGYPMSRAVSADGRWAYTLYTGATPFIHALDTTGRTARCIDMPILARQDLWTLRLHLRGEHLAVTAHGAPVAIVNTRSFRVGRPSPPPPPHAEARHGGVPWVLVAVAAVALVGAVVLVLVLYGSTRPAQITASQASSSSMDAASRAT